METEKKLVSDNFFGCNDSSLFAAGIGDLPDSYGEMLSCVRRCAAEYSHKLKSPPVKSLHRASRLKDDNPP